MTQECEHSCKGATDPQASSLCGTSKLVPRWSIKVTDAPTRGRRGDHVITCAYLKYYHMHFLLIVPGITE